MITTIIASIFGCEYTLLAKGTRLCSSCATKNRQADWPYDALVSSRYGRAIDVGAKKCHKDVSPAVWASKNEKNHNTHTLAC